MSAATIEYSGNRQIHARFRRDALSGGRRCNSWVRARSGTFRPERPAPWNARQLADLVSSIGSIMSGEPAWLPDGSRLVVPAALGGGSVWTVNPDGGALARLTGDLSAQLSRLSPDGSAIAYLSDKSGNRSSGSGTSAEGREAQLTRLGARITGFAWSPDARAIAFAALRFGSFDIWVVSLVDGRRAPTDDERRIRDLADVDARRAAHRNTCVPTTAGSITT
jgi:hypothetical protein